MKQIVSKNIRSAVIAVGIILTIASAESCIETGSLSAALVTLATLATTYAVTRYWYRCGKLAGGFYIEGNGRA